VPPAATPMEEAPMLAELVASDFGHGKGDPYPAPGVESFHFPSLFDINLGFTTIHFTRTLLLLCIGAALIVWLFLAAFRRPKLVPRGLQNFMESVYDFVDQQIARDVIGPEGHRFTPYLTTLFCFVFVMNIFEIIPVANFPVTSRIAFPAMLSLVTYVIFNYIGIRNQGVGGYFKGIAFPPGMPKPMYLLLTPIELFSTLIVRPFTLAVRLFANMFAGHLLLGTFFLGTTYWLVPRLGIVFSGASFVMSVVLVAFELLIDTLQAYIFTMLTAVYISGALAPEH
jgi:F-type H+-transporting ATPase subunit a